MDLTDAQWETLEPLFRHRRRPDGRGRPPKEARAVLNGVLWVLRTGAPWRDVPACYGPWQTVASRYYRWRRAGLWQSLFESVQQQADAAGQMEWAIHDVDGTIVRAHQHAAGSPRGAQAEALGRSQGGFSTKVHLRAADDKHLMTCVLSPGQRHEALGFEPLMAAGAVKRRGRGRRCAGPTRRW